MIIGFIVLFIWLINSKKKAELRAIEKKPHQGKTITNFHN